MSAGKTDDIFIRLANQLIFVAIWLIVLELADTAFVVSRFFSAQCELKAGEVGMRDIHMYFLVYLLLFFLKQLKQVLDLFVKLVFFSDGVDLVHL